MRKTATTTKVALLANVATLGQKGQVFDVKTGYFRNFLAPKSLAVEVKEGEVSVLKKEKEESKNKFLKTLKKTKISIFKLSENTISFTKKAKDDGTLFGSVSVSEIKTEIEKIIGIEIPLHLIENVKPIKHIGMHVFELEFDGEKINLKVEVKPEEGKKK
ncbi:MAG: 50S ribosomal protein L9 [Patescibacteria group bacterium]